MLVRAAFFNFFWTSKFDLQQFCSPLSPDLTHNSYLETMFLMAVWLFRVLWSRRIGSASPLAQSLNFCSCLICSCISAKTYLKILSWTANKILFIQLCQAFKKEEFKESYFQNFISDKKGRGVLKRKVPTMQGVGLCWINSILFFLTKRNHKTSKWISFFSQIQRFSASDLYSYADTALPDYRKLDLKHIHDSILSR